jgi:hypothetical protein
MEKPITHQLFTQKEKTKIKKSHLGLRNLQNQHYIAIVLPTLLSSLVSPHIPINVFF